jgi:hypothetical protein
MKPEFFIPEVAADVREADDKERADYIGLSWNPPPHVGGYRSLI